MIRAANASDIPAMLGMAERFIEKAWGKASVPYDEASCRAVLEGLIEGGIALVSNDQRGMIGVIIHPWHFNANVLTATELFWWCEPGCKAALALQRRAEELAKERGAKTFNMACEHGMRSNALDRLYRMNGFEPSEHVYLKRLM